jgi:hypothetical protein
VKTLFVSIAVLLLPAVALADEQTTTAREHYRRATNAFELGQFDESIREYSEAYRLRDDPAILYNLGQAHRLAQHPGEALHFYKMYLTKVPDAPNRAEVETKIDALQRLLDEQRKTQNLPPASTLSPTAAPEPARVTARPAKAPSPPMSPASAKKVSGLVVGGVGVGLLAAGIAFGVLAKNTSDDLTRLASAHMFDYDKQQAGKRDQLLEGVFLGVGGAVVATGVVLYVLGHLDARHAERAHALTVTPSLGRSFAGVAAQARF